MFKWNINPKKVVSKGWVVLAPESKVQQVGIDFTINENLTLYPVTSKKFKAVNILFQEFVKLPKNVAMDFYLRSSWSRQGIVKSSALFDPGYGSGDIVKETGCTSGLTLINLGTSEITFKKGDRIAQAVFHEASSASFYNGFYNQSVKNIKSQYEQK